MLVVAMVLLRETWCKEAETMSGDLEFYVWGLGRKGELIKTTASANSFWRRRRNDLVAHTLGASEAGAIR